jgi:hypothetical protein
MAAEQKQLVWCRYTDRFGRFFAAMADQDNVANAAFGLQAYVATDPPFGPQTRTHRMRHQYYKDPTTLRVARVLVSANVVLSALPATLAVWVPGLATQVTYNLGQTQEEKSRVPSASYNKIDHP